MGTPRSSRDPSRMGRLRRPHLPGVPFHLTARAQHREPVFTGIEKAAVARILEHVRFSDVLLLAYALMPNHLHLVIVQGARPLASLMHPLMRRLALLVMRTKERQGHVFERRFADTPCLNARHLRNSVAYVHLNACRAGICDTADDFSWCAHRSLCTAAVSTLEDERLQLGMETSLRLFARNRDQTLRACRDDYDQFLQWRLEADRLRAGDDSADELPPPDTTGGDMFWLDRFGASEHSRAEARVRRSIGNLRELAIASIRETSPDLELDDLRSGHHYRSIVRVRNHLVPRALLAGHSQTTLAAFLNISTSTISRIGSR
jgi:REP element-mobilizing transposase RayT